MKFKPTSRGGGGILVELSPKEGQLPVESLEHGEAGLAAFNLKKILVPVDFSECSKKALRYAIPFARQFGAEILLLHVVHYSIGVPEVLMTDAETVSEAETELASLARKIKDLVRSQTALRIGNPPVEIVAAAAESGTDLIILSTHGRSGLAHVFMGSTAERVVRHAPCPVLVVRQQEHEFVVGDADSAS